MSSTVTLNILDLYLKSNNPRHDPLDDKKEIIKYLVVNEKVKVLAKDIVELGGISPLEKIGVTKHDNKYIVEEGNRRVCALMLLNDPDLSPENEKSYFKKLATNNSNIPSVVECFVFDDEDDSKIWVERKHDGEQGGAGPVPWNAVQKSRFFNSSENTLALKLLEHGVQKGLISNSEKNNKIITTASRFLSNPAFRSMMAIKSGKKDNDVVLNVDIYEFDYCLSFFLKDLINKTDNDEILVTSRANKKEILNYIDYLRKNAIAPVTIIEDYFLKDAIYYKKVSTSIDNSTLSPDNPNPNPNLGKLDGDSDSRDATNTRDKKHPNNRKNIINSDYRIHINNLKIRKIFDEIKKLDCREYPLASAFLFRVFLENIFKSYYVYIHQQEPHKDMKVNSILSNIIQEFDPKKTNQTNIDNIQLTTLELAALKSLKLISNNSDNALSFESFGAYAHGSVFPDLNSLKTGWDNISPFISFIIKQAKI